MFLLLRLLQRIDWMLWRAYAASRAVGSLAVLAGCEREYIVWRAEVVLEVGV